MAAFLTPTHHFNISQIRPIFKVLNKYPEKLNNLFKAGDLILKTIFYALISTLLINCSHQTRRDLANEGCIDAVRVIINAQEVKTPPLKQLFKRVEDIMVSGQNPPVYFHALFLYSDRLLNLLERMDSFYNGNMVTFIYTQEENDEIKVLITKLTDALGTYEVEKHDKKLYDDYNQTLHELTAYLESHNYLDVHQIGLEEARGFTEKSINRALDKGLLISEDIQPQLFPNDLKAFIKDRLKKAPRDWENAHLDQGYRLISTPRLTSFKVIGMPDRSAVLGYKMRISAKAKSPGKVAGSITQVFHLDKDLKLINEESEEFTLD